MRAFFNRSARIANCLLWLSALMALATPAWSDDQPTRECRDSVIVGKPGAWDTIWNAAQRNARIRWRQEVRATSTFGSAWDDWGLAERSVPFSDCRDGYCCRTKRIWGVKWHQCSAYAQPCRYVDVPRDGAIDATAVPPRRGGAALVIKSMSLKAQRVSRDNECPAVVMLRATLTATGQIGSVRLRLNGDDTTNSVILHASDFERGADGQKAATYSFQRVFQGAIDRRYWLSVNGPTEWGNEPRRMNPTRVSLNCRRGDIGQLGTEMPQHE